MRQRLLPAAIAAACALVVCLSDPAIGSPSLVASVRADLGTNPVGWKHRWCAEYLRRELRALGFHAAWKRTDARAISFLRLQRTRAHVGAIAVMRHHVGVVTGFPRRGWVEIIGGNQGRKFKHGRRVSRNVYPIGRVVAFVTP